NAPLTRHTLVPFERKQVGDRWVRQARVISDDGRFVTKTIHIEENEREYVERVRLFEPDELMKMLRTAGFDVASLHGDYSGGGWTATSPRAIVVAQRRAASHLSLVSTRTDERPARRPSLKVRTSA